MGTERSLIGVGVGPGDPEQVTVKAVRVMREADTVLVPVMAPDEPGRAEATVRAHVPAGSVRRVVFALNDRGGRSERRVRAWDEAARTVLDRFARGDRRVAFATIGDPNLYSTFGYLAQTVRGADPSVAVETVPGITAMQDLAARSGTVLTEGTESLALVSLTGGTGRLRTALACCDTVVAYKFGAVADQVVAVLEESGRLAGAVCGARLGLPGQDVRPARELTGEVPYLSTLIAPARRTAKGGKL